MKVRHKTRNFIAFVHVLKETFFRLATLFTLLVYDSHFFIISSLLIDGLNKMSSFFRLCLSAFFLCSPVVASPDSPSTGGYVLNKSSKTFLDFSENFMVSICGLDLYTETRSWSPCLQKVLSKWETESKTFQGPNKWLDAPQTWENFPFKNMKVPIWLYMTRCLLNSGETLLIETYPELFDIKCISWQIRWTREYPRFKSSALKVKTAWNIQILAN